MHQQRKSLSWLLEELEELVGEVQQLLEQVLVQQRLALVRVDVVQPLELELVLEQQSRHRNLWQP